MPGYITVNIHLWKRLLYWSGLLFFVLVAGFCSFYLLSSYTKLTEWYLSLNGCFYGKDQWTTRFFSPATKQAGNMLAAAGIVVSATLGGYTLFRLRRLPTIKATVSIPLPSRWHIAVVMLGIVAGIWNWSLVMPSYDEVFSAVNCAELPPFQTLAYYMLPNNHIYFNFLNNVLLGWLHHTVATGRLLSLLAYVGVLVTAYYWLQKRTGNNVFSFLLLLPVALQFFTWGMAAQARGYEWQLLCTWGAFISAAEYIYQRKNYLLALNMLCCVAGFAFVTTFLHYFVAQCLLLLVVAAIERKGIALYLKYAAFIVAIVFLLYLPAFCFSGIPAFTANRYVAPAYASRIAFLPDLLDVVRYFINFCFSMLFGEDRAPNFILFFLPLALFFFSGREKKIIAAFYVLLWLVFILLTLNMRRTPFPRNMILHFSLTMAIVGFTFYLLVHRAAALLSSLQLKKWVLSLCFVTPVLLYSVYLAYTGKRDLPNNLYYAGVNSIYSGHLAETSWIPSNSSIGFSEESFLMFYIFRQDHPGASRCASGKEDYYIKRRDEPMPVGWELLYDKWKDGSEDYELYKRKPGPQLSH